MSSQNRKSIRNMIRDQRRGIAVDISAIATRRICRSMAQLASFKRAEKVAGFLAFDGEADPLELMKLAIQEQKQVFVPIIIAKGQPLQFAPWSPMIPMKLNYFGIEEPDVAPSELISANDLDFVICPLVAFDQRCWRIGVGAGYYDLSFAFLNEFDATSPRHIERPTTMAGFAFEMQKIHEVLSQPWDVQLDWVVTERQLYRRLN